jgi:hyperosmotically inducible periplasmic protein
MRTRCATLLLIAAIFVARPAHAGQMSDSVLADRVADTVRQYVHFGIFDDISIKVDNRSVTLTGRVTMPYKRDDIAAQVKKIDGVRDLTNNVEVLPVSIYDSDLRDRLARAIYGHPAFRHYASMVNPPIHIVVEHGRVTLTGVVNSEVERMLAFSLAQIPGVMGVTNQLKLDR